jgi:hypothetical protein
MPSFNMVHPQNVQLLNVQLQNVQLQNVHLPNVQLQNVQFTKRPDYIYIGCAVFAYIFFRFKAKKIPYFSASFALSENMRRTLGAPVSLKYFFRCNILWLTKTLGTS